MMKSALISLTLLVSVASAAALNWWSVSPEQVADAPCKNHRPPTSAEMLQALQPSSLTKKSEVIFGVSFQNEDPELLQLFRDLHTYDISMAKAKPLALKSSCGKVICATQEIYGSQVGLQLLFMLRRYGFNGSHLRTANASLWKSNELDDILTALSDYPLELYPLDYNRKLVHFTRGGHMNIPEGESVANSTMEVYDVWNKLTQAERQQSLLHELGHVVARKNDIDDSRDWLKIAGWQVTQRNAAGEAIKYALIDASKAVSIYGKTNPHEDWAETVVAYRFGGSQLTQEHAEKYNFLKDKVFDGKEYLSASSCLTSKSRTEIKRETNDRIYATAVAKAQKNANNLDSKFITQAENICLETLVKSMIGESGSTENCTSRALQRLQLEKYGKKLDGSLLSREQLNAIAFKGDTEVDFNRRVRTKFAKDIVKSFSSNVKDSASRNSCDSWGTDAQNIFSHSSLVQDILANHKNYFFTDRRYERVNDFFTRSCESARQNAGRLDLGILQNLP